MTNLVRYLRLNFCKSNDRDIVFYLLLLIVSFIFVLSINAVTFYSPSELCPASEEEIVHCKQNISDKLVVNQITTTSSKFALNQLQYLKKGNRGTCCQLPDQIKDICGRKNCSSPCFDSQQPLIFENSEENAFFLETSGSGTLNIRQACAVESLAFHNHNLKIYVLFMDAEFNSSVITLKKLKEQYGNIQFLSINVDEYVSGTLLESWYHCTNCRKGPFFVSHLSDGLRFLTLHKYGGYYFDLDVILLRPVIYYRNFFCAASDDHYVASGVIHADLKNPIMGLAIKNFVQNYRSDIWAHNGPALILRVLQNWCNVKDLQSMDYISCRGINILSKSSFQPVYYGNIKEFFIHRLADNETYRKPSWLTDKVVGVHTYNNLSKREPIYKNSTQEYTRIARENCPFIFSIAPEIF